MLQTMIAKRKSVQKAIQAFSEPVLDLTTLQSMVQGETLVTRRLHSEPLTQFWLPTDLYGFTYTSLRRNVHPPWSEEVYLPDDPYGWPLHLSDQEVVNGFQLLAWDNDRPLLTRATFDKMLALWEVPDYRNFEAFEDAVKLCSDWHKQDVNGNFYGGYWAFPKGSYEQQNASILSYRRNILELYRLPFPDQVLEEAAELGYAHQKASVRYSNFLCEWVRRKHLQMQKSVYDIIPLDQVLPAEIRNEFDPLPEELMLIVLDYVPYLREKVPRFPDGWNEKAYMIIEDHKQ